MTKFNTNTNTTKTENLAGGEAYEQSPKLALVSLLLTSFLKDQYYRSGEKATSEISEYIDAISDKKFVAKAAIYARDTFGMRSVSHVVAGEIAKRVKGETWTKDFFEKIIVRPDDMAEILAYYWASGAKNEPNALKKGFAKALAKFDEYQLSKYKQDGKVLSLVDVVNLVHPKHSEAIQKLITGKLAPAETWETKLTQAGQKATSEEEKEALKKDAWKTLLMEGKIGYFALLRNLRNILELGDPLLVTKAASLLTNQKMISTSRVLPFRYLTAIGEIAKLNEEGTQEILVALNKAIDLATQNVPKYEGKTLVVLDKSGSMTGEPTKIGSLFGAILVKSNYADFMKFSDEATYQTLNIADSTLTIAQQMAQNDFMGGTNFHAIFQEANKVYDRIIILSDMQGWIGYDAPTDSFQDYKERTGANPRIYSFDLTGYGTMQFPENNVYAIAGFSEKIFDVMKLLEQDRNALIKKIEEVAL